MAAHLCLPTSMWVLWYFVLCFSLPNVGASFFPAIFVFGDSLLDSGNNLKLHNMIKAGFLPYGRDFVTHEPTGRFCNGLLTTDILASLAGLPYPPAYLADPNNILRGTSFAASGAGIMNLTTAGILQLNFFQQVGLFSNARSQLIANIGVQQTSVLLSKSLIVICLGSNDYITNYFGNPFGKSAAQRKYTSEEFRNLLISIYEQYIMELYNLGARKFALVSLSVIGCTPFELLISRSKNGACVSTINDETRKFNTALLQLSERLQISYSDAHFIYLDTYNTISEIISDPPAHGFVYGSQACCGLGPYRGTPCSGKISYVCENASQYVFWDFFHPTQALNEVLTNQYWAGSPPTVNPMNVMQLAAV